MSGEEMAIAAWMAIAGLACLGWWRERVARRHLQSTIAATINESAAAHARVEEMKRSEANAWDFARRCWRGEFDVTRLDTMAKESAVTDDAVDRLLRELFARMPRYLGDRRR